MQKRYSAFLLPLVVLLFVGSSGCTESDVLTILEVTHDIDPLTEGGPALLGGVKTGDKDKDAVLDSVNTANDIKKATALEAAADADLAKRPPLLEAALANIDAALKLRPNDWALQNKRATILAELGKATGAVSHFGVAAGRACDPDAMLPANDPGFARCWGHSMRNAMAELEASRERQKNGGGLVKCATYLAMEQQYDYLSRIIPEEGVRAGFTMLQLNHYGDLASTYRNLARRPGQSCSQ